MKYFGYKNKKSLKYFQIKDKNKEIKNKLKIFKLISYILIKLNGIK